VTTTPHRGRALVPALALATMLALAGCASGGTGISGDYTGAGDGDYVSADGTTQFFAPEHRGDPIEFEGVTESGDRVSSADFTGRVLLVNFWYASCGPCRTEADDLNALYDEFAPQGVAFLGVNIRDDAPTARSFEEQFEVEYPSVLDVGDAAVTLAFARPAPPSTTPTTFLLDREGRVAARFTSAIDPRVTVVAAMIDDLLAEQ